MGIHSRYLSGAEGRAVILTNGERGINMIWKQLLKSLVDDFVL